MRKAYASQESVAATLTAAERAAPFQISDVDPEPLPKRTREPVLADERGVFASGLSAVLAVARQEVAA